MMENRNIIDKLDNIIELLEQEKVNRKSRIRHFIENIIFGIGRGFGISIGMIVISAITKTLIDFFIKSPPV